SGAARGRSVRTVSVGYERSGSRLSLRRDSETKPNRTTATVTMRMVTRRRVANSTTFIARSAGRRGGGKLCSRRARGRVHDADGRTGLDCTLADDDNLLAVLETLR